MKIDITISRAKKLPEGALSELEKELSRRINNKYENCQLLIRLAGADSLSVIGGDKEVKKDIEEILQETWESADDWFIS